MNIQKMLASAQIIQKKIDEFKKEQFTFTYQEELITIIMTGDREIIEINIEKLMQEFNNDAGMIKDMLKVALNQALAEINQKEKVIASNFK